MNSLIHFHDAEIINGEQAVIYGLDMDINVGDFAYIVGKVGTGKTSIIRTIIAENPLRKGQGSVCGFNLRDIREKDVPMLRRTLGIVFQDFQLLTDRNVEENLSFVLRATGWKDKDAADKRIETVLKAVGMQNKAHKMPHQLSGGEQQRIAIARAILNNPKVIIADEPTGNLDAETADSIMNLLARLNKEYGTAIVMVTHDKDIFQRFPGRVFVCRDERCRERSSSSSEEEVIDISI